jgi:MSHA pilin protein MshD
LLQRGVSLIELIMFIVIIGIAVMGILGVMNQIAVHSADPLIRKQALAIAESLLEEVELMPYTYCDPNDASAVSATNTAGCFNPANSQDVITGPTPGSETRYSASDPFDNVADYSGCQMGTGVINACDATGTGGIRDIGNNAIGPANGYTAKIDIARTGTAMSLPANDAALRITVTVTGPDSVPVVLDGYRTRYAPNSMP